MVQELGVCWNDAFRKIFNYSRWESVKLLQFFSGCLDFVHMYDLLKLHFPSYVIVITNLPFPNVLCASMELQYHTVQNLCDNYGAIGPYVTAAVYCSVMQSRAVDFNE